MYKAIVFFNKIEKKTIKIRKKYTVLEKRK